MAQVFGRSRQASASGYVLAECVGNSISLEAEENNVRKMIAVDNDALFDTRQAANHYGLSESYLNKLRVSGGGCPFAKLGRRVLYRKKDLDAWIGSQLRNSTSDPGGLPPPS